MSCSQSYPQQANLQNREDWTWTLHTFCAQLLSVLRGNVFGILSPEFSLGWGFNLSIVGSDYDNTWSWVFNSYYIHLISPFVLLSLQCISSLNYNIIVKFVNPILLVSNDWGNNCLTPQQLRLCIVYLKHKWQENTIHFHFKTYSIQNSRVSLLLCCSCNML